MEENGAMDIQVDSSQLVEKSNEINILTAEMSKIMENIEILILSVNGGWQGDAEKAFSEKILYVKKNFSPIAAFFKEYAELLKSFAYAYEQQEADLTSKINLA